MKCHQHPTRTATHTLAGQIPLCAQCAARAPAVGKTPIRIRTGIARTPAELTSACRQDANEAIEAQKRKARYRAIQESVQRAREIAALPEFIEAARWAFKAGISRGHADCTNAYHAGGAALRKAGLPVE